MSDEQQNGLPSQELSLPLQSLFSSDQVFTDGHYSSVLEQVNRARAVLDNVEQEAHQRHGMYQQALSALQARVQAGQEAQRLLERLGSQASQSVPLIAGTNTEHRTSIPGTFQPPPPVGQYTYPQNAGNGYQQFASTSSAAHQQSPVYPPPPPQTQQYYRSHTYRQPPQHETPQAQVRPPTYESSRPRAAPAVHGGSSTQHRAYGSQPAPRPNAPVNAPQNRQQNPPRPTRFESHRAPPSSSPSFQPGAGVTLSQPSRPADVRRATTSAPHAIPSSSTSSSLTGALGHQTTAQPTKGAQMEGSSMSHENQRTRERAKQQVLVVMQTVQAARPDLLDVVVKLTLQKLLRLQRIALEPTTTLLVNTVAVPPEIRSYVQEISDLLTNALQELHGTEIGTIISIGVNTVRAAKPSARPDESSMQNDMARASAPHTQDNAEQVESPSMQTDMARASASRTQVNAERAPSPSPFVAYQAKDPTPKPQQPPATQPTIQSSTNTSQSVQPQVIALDDVAPSISPHVHAAVSTNPMVTMQSGPLGHPAPHSNNRSSQTVFSTPSRQKISAEPGLHGALTPNPKTLAKDILRSLGRSVGSPSSVNSPSPGNTVSVKRKRSAELPERRVQQTTSETNTVSQLPLEVTRREVIVIDDSSSLSSTEVAPADVIRMSSEPLPIEPEETQAPDIEHSEDPAEAQEIQEIHTPGAIQMAYVEAQEMLQGDRPTVNFATAADDTARPPSRMTEVTSPMLESAASLPPPSRSSTPVEAGSPSIRSEVPSTPQHVPVAGSSKEPLFLDSPTATPSVENRMTVDTGADSSSTDGFVPSGLLGFGSPQNPSRKGKERMVASPSSEDDTKSPNRPSKRRKVIHDSDSEVVATPESEEDLPPTSFRPTFSERHSRKVVVEIEPMSGRIKKFKEQFEAGSSSRSEVVRRGRMGSAAKAGPRGVTNSRNLKDRPLRLLEERQALQMSSACLHETPCRWQGCGAILESAERLGRHAPLHALEQKAAPFICEWEDCGRRFPAVKDLGAHLKGHSHDSLLCAYAGCEHIALTPSELAEHHKEPQHRSMPLKPTAALAFWANHPPPPPLPQTLPSYMSVPLRISKACLSPEAHAWFGANVAANITCYVHPGKRSNAAVPSCASRRLSARIASIELQAQEAGKDPTQAVLHMTHGEYDEWIGYASQRGPKYCDNLAAAEVTSMVAKGLVIGAKYLAGDSHRPIEDEDEDADAEYDELEEDSADVGNDSERTIVIEGSGIHPAALTKIDGTEGAFNAEEQVPAEPPVDTVTDIIHTEVPPQSSGDLLPDAQAGEEHSPNGRGASSGASETMSLPRWDVLPGDDTDVENML